MRIFRWWFSSPHFPKLVKIGTWKICCCWIFFNVNSFVSLRLISRSQVRTILYSTLLNKVDMVAHILCIHSNKIFCTFPHTHTYSFAFWTTVLLLLLLSSLSSPSYFGSLNITLTYDLCCSYLEPFSVFHSLAAWFHVRASVRVYVPWSSINNNC